jgi:hypothetical protein
MVRRYLILLLAFSVILLGVPGMANAGVTKSQAPGHAMADCVCPPGHDMPPHDHGLPSHDDDSGTCTSSLACMAACAVTPPALPTDIALFLPVPEPSVAVSQAIELDLSSISPPFRPPSV